MWLRQRVLDDSFSAPALAPGWCSPTPSRAPKIAASCLPQNSSEMHPSWKGNKATEIRKLEDKGHEEKNVGLVLAWAAAELARHGQGMFSPLWDQPQAWEATGLALLRWRRRDEGMIPCNRKNTCGLGPAGTSRPNGSGNRLREGQLLL